MAKLVQDIAYSFLRKRRKPFAFEKLWAEVSKEMGLDESAFKQRTIKFYNALNSDSRFVQLEKNTWDLRERVVYDKYRTDLSKFEQYVEEDDVVVDEINDEVYEIYESEDDND